MNLSRRSLLLASSILAVGCTTRAQTAHITPVQQAAPPAPEINARAGLVCPDGTVLNGDDPDDDCGDDYGGDDYGGGDYGGHAYGGGDYDGSQYAPQRMEGQFKLRKAIPSPDDPAIAAFLPTFADSTNKPDPSTTYSVPVGTSSFDGDVAAPVTLVVVLDVDEYYSSRILETLLTLQTEYGAKLRIVWKSFVVHYIAAQTGALAMCAAGQQHKLVPFAQEVFSRRFPPGPYFPQFSEALWLDGLRISAQAAGLDMMRWASDLYSTFCHDQVVADQVMGTQLGVTGVPQSWINGRPLAGALYIPAFRTLIDEEFAKAMAATKGRPKKLKRYYDGLVKTGKPEA